MSRGKKLWYHEKGLVAKNTYVQYESPITCGKKVMAKVLKFFESRSNFKVNVPGQKLWYHEKGLVTSNTHVQYESPITCGKKVMVKAQVFQK